MSGTLEGLLGTRRRRGGLLDNPDPVEALRESLPAGPQRDEVRMPSPGFRELDTRDPTARMALRAGVGQTVDDTARMYRQALDAAGWGGTMAAGRGIRAFHGSPHQFDRFDMSRIGTGEGAQMYGRGLYFAEAEPVAETYLQNASWTYRGRPSDELYQRFYDRVSRPGAGPADSAAAYFWEQVALNKAPRAIIDDAIRNADDWPELAAYARTLRPDDFKRIGGNMYEVNLRVDPNRLLDWDAPLGQNERAMRVLARTGQSPGSLEAYGRTSLSELPGPTAQTLIGTPEGVERLRRAGVPGIRYLDAGSRGTGEGTRNYVMFDDRLIDILRRYAIPGFLGGGAAAANTEGLLQ